MNQFLNNDIYNDFAYVYAKQDKYHLYSKRLSETIIEIMKEQDFLPRTVVDLACGVGIAAEIFSKSGHEVIGIDRSDKMLSYAKQRSSESNLGIRFYRQEMENLLLDQGVDLITCMYDSLNYITDESTFYQTMDNVISNLNDSGWFVFDLATPLALSDTWVGVDILRNNKDFLEIHNASYDKNEGVNIKNISFYIQDNGSFRHLFETHFEKAHSPDDVEIYLKSKDMEIFNIFSSPDRGQVCTDSDRLIYFTRKRSK